MDQCFSLAFQGLSWGFLGASWELPEGFLGPSEGLPVASCDFLWLPVASWSSLWLPGASWGFLGASSGPPWGYLRLPGALCWRPLGSQEKKNTYLKRIGFGTQKLVYIKSIFTLGHKEGKGTFSVAK